VAAGAPALIHCDAVQAFCRLPMEPARLGIDLVSVSAHKIHGPKGTGALYMRSGARITPLLFGGGQEKGLRPGTHAVELIAAFGAAASVAAEGRAGFMREIAALRGYCLDRLVEIGGVTVNSPADAAPHILSISCEGIPSEVMLNHLSANGVYVSAGSACSRGARSHVLAAMALPEARAASALRISFSRFNTKEDVDLLCGQLEVGLATIKRAGKRH
ncbi:MAG: aminotransferase class V-fold PLP-dependent enzyme, partial [Clostridia bacterium]|nr:aminotransferase class V-fold PLP-dependent enzyme [Clostridia bacterium]